MSAPSSDSAGIRQVVRALRKAGYRPYKVLYSPDEGVNVVGKTESEIVEAIMAVDDANLFVYEGHVGQTGGWVRFVMGNDPEEVVCDYTIGLSHVLNPLTEGWWS